MNGGSQLWLKRYLQRRAVRTAARPLATPKLFAPHIGGIHKLHLGPPGPHLMAPPTMAGAAMGQMPTVIPQLPM